MTPAQKKSVFYFGMLGGALPTCATLASTYVASPETPLPTFGLFFGWALWAIIGGAVALMNTSPETRHAIFAGIAAPAILLNIISGATEAGSRKGLHKSEQTALTWGVFAEALVPAARAQDATKKPQFDSGFSSGFSSVQFSPIVDGGVPTNAAIPVTAQLETAGKVESLRLGEINDLNAVATFMVPSGWTVYVSGKPVALTGPVTKVNLAVKTKTSGVADFLWALGVPRHYTIENVALPVQK
jgi:hypothetical protein